MNYPTMTRYSSTITDASLRRRPTKGGIFISLSLKIQAFDLWPLCPFAPETIPRGSAALRNLKPADELSAGKITNFIPWIRRNA